MEIQNDPKDQRKRVLVLDDSELELRLTLMALGSMDTDIDVTGCRNAHEALKLLRENPSSFDLLIQDHIRPCMNSLEVLQQIRETPALQALPVIVLTTGIPDESIPGQLLELGAEILQKPPRIAVLEDAVKRALHLEE